VPFQSAPAGLAHYDAARQILDVRTAGQRDGRHVVSSGDHLQIDVGGRESGSQQPRPVGRERALDHLPLEDLDETRRVNPGDLVFIPRGALYGRVRTIAVEMAALPIHAPRFDKIKRNIVWHEDD